MFPTAGAKISILVDSAYSLRFFWRRKAICSAGSLGVNFGAGSDVPDLPFYQNVGIDSFECLDRGSRLTNILFEGQSGKIKHDGVEASSATVFKLHFGTAIVAGLQTRSLNHRHVQERLVQTVAVSAIHLHGTLHFAQTNDPRLRFGEG